MFIHTYMHIYMSIYVYIYMGLHDVQNSVFKVTFKAKNLRNHCVEWVRITPAKYIKTTFKG